MDQKVKGFFERPEGKTGLLFIGLGILAFLFAGNYLMPFIITALANTLHAALLGGTLLFMLFLVMNDKVRALASSMFKSVMRAITGVFITIDPIGILKNYLDHMSERLGEIAKSIAELNGQKLKLDRTIAEEQRNAEKATHMASAAKKQGNAAAVTMNMRKVARSQEFVQKLQGVRDKMEFLDKVLSKMHTSVQLLREDTKDQVRLLETEYESMRSAHKAMKSAERLVQGSAEKELFEQSAEYLVSQIDMKMGEIDTFMTLSEDFMTKVDLQNGAWDEQGLAMLEQFEKTGEILSYEEQRAHGGKVRVENHTQHVRVGVDSNPQAPVVDYAESQTKSSAMADFFKN